MFGKVGATSVAPTNVSGRNREKKGAVRRKKRALRGRCNGGSTNKRIRTKQREKGSCKKVKKVFEKVSTTEEAFTHVYLELKRK
ncbi:hypothetical protein [Salipaludibacillus aurantiacus]|uniref:Uncharacterized protein n=1 Tax=Salipaludibacillus aurantiacus TaxID=1601833 RepID=A0A1H9VBV4_9BACI|nr:hypothetical protein [Salipaludibacillus aurantiacus]SES19290.1 hypothetical protein SAMN05518684_11086 [Salipaludibacillus aurantiacus]